MRTLGHREAVAFFISCCVERKGPLAGPSRFGLGWVGRSALVLAGDAGADGADNVVGVGALEGGPVLNGDFVVAVTAKEGNDVTNAGLGDIIEVDGEVVHGEAAEDRDGDAADEDGAAIGKGEGEAVGITGADGAHAHGAASAIGVAVADGRALGEVTNLR